jgi:Domain of unknown function (DUF5667)
MRIVTGDERGHPGEPGRPRRRATLRMRPGDERLRRSLGETGRSMPTSGGAGRIREELISAAAVARSSTPGRKRRGTATVRLFAVARRAAIPAVALALALAVVVPVGVSSSHAMPGSALYPVKRGFEKAQVIVAPRGEGKAGAYLAQAAKRLDELQYVLSKGLNNWYFGLVRDAQGEIDDARGESTLLGGESARNVDREADDLARQQEELSREVLPAMRPAEGDAVKSWLEDEKKGEQARLKQADSLAGKQVAGQDSASPGRGVREDEPSD